MSSRKERRRAKKQSDALRAEAWEAVARGRLELARRRLERALEEGPGNARLWLDRGRIARLEEDARGAESAVRRALELSPTYAEAHDILLELLVERGAGTEAVEVQRRWTDRIAEVARTSRRHDPVELETEEARLAELRGRFGLAPPEEGLAALDELGTEPDTSRTERYDWEALEAELVQRGCGLLPGLLTPDECAGLVALDGQSELFADTRFAGEGSVRRTFRQPLPALVRALRAELYRRTLPLARRWISTLGRGTVLPARLEGFLEACRRAEQTRPTPALLRHEFGASQALRRDAGAALSHPLRLVASLGPPAAAEGEELEFVLADLRAGKGRRGTSLPLGIGDGVLFGAGERPLLVGGAWGRQPVEHGITGGAPRFDLELSFEDEV